MRIVWHLISWMALSLMSFQSFSQSPGQSLAAPAESEARRWTVVEVLKNLATTPTGSQIIASANTRALEMGINLLQAIVPGDFSTTSNNFIFRFNPQNPVETLFELEVTIFIDRNVGLDEATWHLAHELTHFIEQDLIHPYDLDNAESALEKIVREIEGKGGEVDAFFVGCRVFDELVGGLIQHPACHEVTDEKGNIDRDEVVKLYYRLGPYYQDFVRGLNAQGISASDLPHLSLGSSESSFILYGNQIPYPVAIFAEYFYHKREVCATHRRRLGLMDAASEEYRRLESLVDNYCL